MGALTVRLTNRCGASFVADTDRPLLDSGYDHGVDQHEQVAPTTARSALFPHPGRAIPLGWLSVEGYHLPPVIQVIHQRVAQRHRRRASPPSIPSA